MKMKMNNIKKMEITQRKQTLEEFNLLLDKVQTAVANGEITKAKLPRSRWLSKSLKWR